MKLKHFFPHRSLNSQTVQRFGAAQLIRNPDGTHDLIGGNRDDLAAANEWVSLFAHDIVFSAVPHQRIAHCRARREKMSPRIRFAW